MAAKLATFLATCLALCACLAGMRRLYAAVSAIPLEELSPAAPAAKPVRPIVLPAERSSPDFGYADEAREMQERPGEKLDTAARQALEQEAAAMVKARRESAPPEEKAPPPEKKAKAKVKPAPRDMESKPSVRELLEQARQRAGRLQRVSFRQDETVMTGGASIGGASPGPAGQAAGQAGPGGQAGPSAGSSAAPSAAPQRAMRAVSMGGSNQPAIGTVQRADQTPAAMSDNPGQYEPPDSTP